MIENPRRQRAAAPAAAFHRVAMLGLGIGLGALVTLAAQRTTERSSPVSPDGGTVGSPAEPAVSPLRSPAAPRQEQADLARDDAAAPAAPPPPAATPAPEDPRQSTCRELHAGIHRVREQLAANPDGPNRIDALHHADLLCIAVLLLDAGRGIPASEITGPGQVPVHEGEHRFSSYGYTFVFHESEFPDHSRVRSLRAAQYERRRLARGGEPRAPAEWSEPPVDEHEWRQLLARVDDRVRQVDELVSKFP